MESRPHISLELQLQRLFEVLRQERDIRLGLSEFMDAIRAANAGFLVGDVAELRRLCLLLWAKSREQAVVVGHHFDRVMGEVLAELEDDGEIADQLLQPPVHQPSEDSHITQPPAPIQSPSAQEDPRTAPSDPSTDAHPLAAEVPTTSVGPRRFLLRRVPVADRTRAQAWRKLRQLDRVGSRTELDLDATLDSIARQGYFLDVAYQKAFENVTRLHFLVDREGSMVPFHGLCRSLLRGAQHEGDQRLLDVRYFHDWPQDQVYREELLSDPEEWKDWLRELDPRRSLVVILSDAGAARGNMDRYRIRETEGFLAALGLRCRRMAWLNPLPVSRWAGTSAGEIAQSVPMFSIEGHGIGAAVDHLRGKYVRFLERGGGILP